jgi:hypothetical protein
LIASFIAATFGARRFTSGWNVMMNKLSSNFHGVCLVRVYSLPFRGSIRSFGLIVK